MNTVEQNRKDFVAFVRKQLNKCGIKLNLRASKKHLDGDYGMFCEPDHGAELCVASGMSRDKFFHTLAHEYVHFLQWCADDPLYRASRDDARDYYALEKVTEESALEILHQWGLIPESGWSRVRESSEKYVCSVFVRGPSVRVSRKPLPYKGIKNVKKT